MDESSGVGVLDKSVAVLAALEAGPATLASLVAVTGLSRPTAHRLAVALEHHRLVARDARGRFVLGPWLAELAAHTAPERLVAIALPVLARLRDHTGESAQLYQREGDERVCMAAAELASGLRDTVPVGSRLPMTAGSAAQVLLAWEGANARPRDTTAFTEQTLAAVRRRGWAASVSERQAGVASVSAPVHGPDGRIVAAVSVSGPIERLTRNPGRLHGGAVLDAGREIERGLRRAG